MKPQRIFLIAAILLAAGTRSSAAQWNVARYDSSKTWAYGSYGLDPGFVGALGVARNIASLGETQIGVEAGLVVARPDARDMRGRLSVRTSVFRVGAIRLTGEGEAIARTTSNSIYRAVGFGAASNWTFGVYRPRWFVAAEAGYDKSVATRITHSDWYRSYFDPTAKDGWYGDTGGTLHSGVTTGLTIGRVELMMRAGLLRTERFNETLPPAYGSVGLGYAIK